MFAARSALSLSSTIRRATTTQTRAMSVFSTSRLVGKNVLITGASSGIGAATAALFSRAGASVALLARRQKNLAEVAEKCAALHKENGFQHAKVVTIEADMRDREALGDVLGKAGKVDILVNNAGLVKGREHVGEISNEDIDVMFQTNVIGLFHLTQLAVNDFKKRNEGMIINLGSVAGIEPYAGGSIYCATKFAVNAISGSLIRELVNTNIRVAEILPGMVETEFSVVRYRGDKDRATNEYKGIDPLTGEDVAEQIVWVASRPPHVQIAEILMFPTNQASATTNYRRPE